VPEAQKRPRGEATFGSENSETEISSDLQGDQVDLQLLLEPELRERHGENHLSIDSQVLVPSLQTKEGQKEGASQRPPNPISLLQASYPSHTQEPIEE
jgi:hypothetical protein